MKESKKSQAISEIITIEYELTMAVLSGHKPNNGDIYVEKRKRIKELRKKFKIS